MQEIYCKENFHAKIVFFYKIRGIVLTKMEKNGKCNLFYIPK